MVKMVKRFSNLYARKDVSLYIGMMNAYICHVIYIGFRFFS